ncbi:MAG: lysylphosphatidylglycerol synthase transmembrane domain-containing protein [Gemmatimonadota bacterium]
MTAESEWMTAERRNAFSRWWPRLRVLISLGLLALVLSQIDLARVALVLGEARLGLLALAVAVYVAGRFFAAFRWHLLIRAMNADAPYLGLVRLTFIGMFLQFLPAGTVALEASRVDGLRRETEDLAGSVASVLAERVFGLFALIVVALVGLSLAPPGVPPALARLAGFGMAAAAVGCIAVMSTRSRDLLDRALRALGLEIVRERLGKLYIRLDTMRGHPALLAWSLAAALFNTSFRIVPAYLVALAIGVQVSLLQLFIIVPIIVFAQQIPISVGGLGVREVGWVALLGVIGVPASDAVVLSLLLVGVILVTSLPGAWLYARHGLEAPGSPQGESPENPSGGD